MGNVLIPDTLELEFIPFVSWNVDKVLKVYARFDQLNGALWNIGYEHFKLCIGSKEGEDCKGLWNKIKDPVESVNILEVVALLLSICRASLAQKVAALFDLFDVTGRGILNVSDLTIVVAACLYGICKATGQTKPSHGVIRGIAHEIFVCRESMTYLMVNSRPDIQRFLSVFGTIGDEDLRDTPKKLELPVVQKGYYKSTTSTKILPPPFGPSSQVRFLGAAALPGDRQRRLRYVEMYEDHIYYVNICMSSLEEPIFEKRPKEPPHLISLNKQAVKGKARAPHTARAAFSSADHISTSKKEVSFLSPKAPANTATRAAGRPPKGLLGNRGDRVDQAGKYTNPQHIRSDESEGSEAESAVSIPSSVRAGSSAADETLGSGKKSTPASNKRSSSTHEPPAHAG